MSEDRIDAARIAERVSTYIAEAKGLGPVERPSPEASLLQLGLLDSLGMVDLIAYLEAEFGIEIDDDDLLPENFESVSAIATFVSAQLAR